MKKIVSLFSFLFFFLFCNSLLAEVDIEFLKQKYRKCENENYRHDCFDEVLFSDVKKIGYYRNNSLWDGQHFQNDFLTFEYVDGEQITKSFCNEGNDGWYICRNETRYKPIEDGGFDSQGKREGKFIVEFSGGDKFVGKYKYNKMHGPGTLIYASGAKYVGEFKEDFRNGQGTYTYVNGDKYVGEWKKGVKSGRGTFTWVSGDKYVGEWKEDRRNGQGTLIFSDGTKWDGAWENGNLNGYAIQYNSDGNIIREGIFKDDEFLYAQTREKKKPSKLDKYKEFCEEIGFKPGTEKFADCVLEAMKKD